ncbi:MAG: DEAD/DEAH box helicase [Puniceicoccales bacterium]|nr:DEAD/DEAH box helicase [Puniceicoccales bacterium]
MYRRPPVLTFTKEAMEAWMSRICDLNWPNIFSKETIGIGNNIFESGMVREIDMRCNDVIVRFLDEYRVQTLATIEHGPDGFGTRSSCDDAEKSDAFIVASFLALENSIAEKNESIFADDGTPKQNYKARTMPNNSVENPPSERIKLKFFITNQVLCFKAFWSDTLSPVLSDKNFRSDSTASAKKSALIKLVHTARKFGFMFSKKAGEYRLYNLPQAIDFCRSTMPKLTAAFDLELDDNVKLLANGLKHLTPVIKTAMNGDSIDLHFDMMDGQTEINTQARQLVLHSNGHTIFIPGIGVTKLDKKTVNAIREQMHISSKFDGDLPRYMIYSIFVDSDIAIAKDDNLLTWQKSFETKPNTSVVMPEFLRQYQKEGVTWMAHLLNHGFHGLLADDMGLGKTLQVLTFISRYASTKCSVVICPASVVPVWKHEAEKFFPELTVKIFSSADKTIDDCNLIITSYTQLRRNKAIFSGKKFQLAILDEAQCIKNPSTKVFAACLAIDSTWRLALSGTPIENNIQDLWSIFRFLMPGLLQDQSKFIEFSKNDDRAAEKIKKQIGPFMLRRTKESVAEELPEKIEIDLPCTLTTRQRNLYETTLEKAIKRYDVDGNTQDINKFGILAILTKLRQIACDPGIVPGIEADFEESCKLESLNQKLAEILNNGKKIVIFSQFVTFLKRIREFLKSEYEGIKIFEITGATKKRDDVVKNFQEFEGPCLILISLKAGGTGITLTAAEYVFLMDPWWNPAVERQAMDRVHRIGQNKKVTVYRLISDDTIESKIQILQQNKNMLFGDIIDSLKTQQSGGSFFMKHIKELLEAPRK